MSGCGIGIRKDYIRYKHAFIEEDLVTMRFEDEEKTENLVKEETGAEGTATQTFTFSETEEDDATLSDRPADSEHAVLPVKTEKKQGSPYKKIAIAAGIAVIGALAVVIGTGIVRLKDTAEKPIESSIPSAADSSVAEDTAPVITQAVSEPAESSASSASSAAESSESTDAGVMEIRYSLERDDRSGTATAKSGLELPYFYYYDQVMVDEGIPNADIFNAETERRKNEFFSGEEPSEIITNGTDSVYIIYAYDRYVTYKDSYVGDGIFSVYLTYEWVSNGFDAAEFAGYTFDFRTGEWITFDQYLGVSEEEARLLAEEACARFSEGEGMAPDSINNHVIQFLNTGYDPSKFFISQDGRVFLVNDRIGRRMEVYEVRR